MRLHNFFRSGTSHRLRIVMRLEGLAVDDLRRDAQLEPGFRALNPQAMAPALELDDGRVRMPGDRCRAGGPA